MGKLVNALKDDYYKAKNYSVKIACADFALKVTQTDFLYRCKHKAILEWIKENYSDIITEPLNCDATDIAEDAPIWIYWKQGFDNAPETVKICLASIKANCGKHSVIELSDANIDKYVQIPDDIQAKLNSNVIPLAFYADIVRISLLAKYGGIWMDATMFMIAPFDEQIYHHSFYTNHMEGINDEEFVTKYKWSVYFLACGEHNAMMELCRRLMVKYAQNQCKDVHVDYFFFDYTIASLYMMNSECKKMIDNVPVNNQMIFWFRDNCSNTYNSKKWEKVIESTYIFKIERRIVPTEKNGNTYYDVCMRTPYINSQK